MYHDVSPQAPTVPSFLQPKKNTPPQAPRVRQNSKATRRLKATLERKSGLPFKRTSMRKSCFGTPVLPAVLLALVESGLLGWFQKKHPLSNRRHAICLSAKSSKATSNCTTSMVRCPGAAWRPSEWKGPLSNTWFCLRCFVYFRFCQKVF